MCVIIEFDRDHPPIVWLEVTKFANILRSNEGRLWAKLHHNIKEVLFNIGQDIQSTIAGFVSEARKTSYKKAIKDGKPISVNIFASAQEKGDNIRKHLQSVILHMQARTYKEASMIFKLFQPDQPKDNQTKKGRREQMRTPIHPPPATNLSNRDAKVPRVIAILLHPVKAQAHWCPLPVHKASQGKQSLAMPALPQ